MLRSEFPDGRVHCVTTVRDISALFWVITQRVVAIVYDVSGKSLGPIFNGIGCPQTSLRNYHYWLRNDSEECISRGTHAQ